MKQQYSQTLDEDAVGAGVVRPYYETTILSNGEYNGEEQAKVRPYYETTILSNSP